ncbi:MAG: HD domain-containing protein [Longimicrobiales bacterium]
MSEKRRAHIARVAALMREWALQLALPHEHVTRWSAAGYLHDALRDADPETLRPLVPPALADLDRRLLHGPAAAARLRRDGVDDAELLDAITYHTIGHVQLTGLGRALYLADFLEPGRTHDADWTAAQRARMPDDQAEVLRDVAARRLARQIQDRRPLRPESVRFWNALLDGTD